MSQSEDVINIQILYNPNQLIESEYWNGTLQPVSLHDSSEHLLSNMKNIKNSMIHITKYVENKKININKSNEVPKLRSISKVTWKLISAIYSSKWDLLFADNNNNSFRQKVSFKCILNVNPMKDSVKIVDDGLYFIFPFHFILFSLFSFLFLFPFLEQLRLGFISHAVTSVTN